jgi:tripartite ATP-independent transporter DctP family solute receptor
MFQIRRLLCSLAICIHPAFAQTPAPTEIRVAHALSDDSHVGRAIAVASERIKRDSGGRLVVKGLGNSAAGSDSKAMEDAVAGTLEIFISSTTTIVPAYKPLAVWDTPFLFANREEAHTVLDSKIGQSLLDGVSAGGLIGLAYWELGFRNVTNNVRPVTRVEDFANIRLRTMPSELSINTFRRLGVDAKPLPFPELRAALASNQFDGQENPYPTIVSARLHEVQKYLTVTNHLYGAYGVMASKKWWETLPAADRKLVRDAFAEARLFQREEAHKASDAALATIKGAGVKVSNLEAGERWRISRRLERVVGQIASNVGVDVWIDVTNTLNDVRSQKSPSPKP